MDEKTDSDKKLVSLVVPFYNESESIKQFYDAIMSVFASLPALEFEVVCIDDGSSDDTLAKLRDLVEIDTRFRVIELSRNFGKEAALTAGIDSARGAAVIPFDADLQDPPEMIPKLIEHWIKGAEVVLARRVDRSTDAFFKQKTAEFFYKVHNKLSSTKIPNNVGDFRLMDRVVVNALKLLPERQRFMKGLFAWVGYKTVTVDYVRNSRVAGTTKFSGWKLWNFALEGITSFSTVPLRIWTYIGGIGALITITYGLIIVMRTLILGIDLPGYASLLVSILFFGSLQLIGIGVLGEYVGRLYMENKQRPIYLIRGYYESGN